MQYALGGTTNLNPPSPAHGESTSETSIQDIHSSHLDNPDSPSSFESKFEFDFDTEAFENHLRDATSHLKDDFSFSTFETENSSESSYLEFTDASWFDNFFDKSHSRLDKEMAEIKDCFFSPSHIQGRHEDKCARASSTRSLLHPGFNSHPNPSSKKVLSLKYDNLHASKLNATSSEFENSSTKSLCTSFVSKGTHFAPKETSFASYEPHPLEESFTSFLS